MILTYFYTSVHVKRIQKAVHLFVIELQNIFCYTIYTFMGAVGQLVCSLVFKTCVGR